MSLWPERKENVVKICRAKKVWLPRTSTWTRGETAWMQPCRSRSDEVRRSWLGWETAQRSRPLPIWKLLWFPKVDGPSIWQLIEFAKWMGKPISLQQHQGSQRRPWKAAHGAERLHPFCTASKNRRERAFAAARQPMWLLRVCGSDVEIPKRAAGKLGKWFVRNMHVWPVSLLVSPPVRLPYRRTLLRSVSLS